MTTFTTTFDQLMSVTAASASAAAARKRARAGRRRAAGAAAAAVLGLLRAYLTALLSVAGAVSLVYAAFTLGLTIGFVGLGVALILMAAWLDKETGR